MKNLKTVFCWLVLLGFAFPVTEVAAQVPLQEQDEKNEQDEKILADTYLQKENSVFFPVPREMLRPLIRANRAIRENEPARAVTLLGEVLSESTDEDFLVPLSGVDGLSVSLRNQAQRILGRLPSKERDLYRLRYGVQAKQLLAVAIEESDFGKVSEVMQRFFYTDAGFDAAMLMGHHHLDEGRVVAAANCFQRICDSPDANSKYDPEASVLLAICWMMADSESRAESTLNALRERTDERFIEFGGKQVRLLAENEAPGDWLKKLIGASPLRHVEVVNQWLMTGGNPQRNARSGSGFPLYSARWAVPTINDPDIQKIVENRFRDLLYRDACPIPSVQPLAVGDTIVMRTFDRMIGVDFQTGKRKWFYPPFDFASSWDESGDPLERNVMSVLPLSERLFMDVLYGQASSDARRVFVIPNPGVTPNSGTGSPGEQLLAYRPTNELKALDIVREGAFLWAVGGESGGKESKLANAFFLGPPLPIGEELYVLCQQKSEIKLVVLDAQTGSLLWQQRLGTTENSRDLRTDTYRRLAGVVPSFADGILVCPTGTGALVAVELSTRSLLWGYQYTTPGRRNLDRLSPFERSSDDPYGGIWRESKVVIANGKVLYSPVDAQSLVCVELQSGVPGFRQEDGSNLPEVARADSLFIACVEESNAVLIGKQAARAVNIQTGKLVWELSLNKVGRPSGKGYANAGYYYFPTTDEKLVRIDIAKGQIDRVVETDGILGNLINFKGEVISHGANELRVFAEDTPAINRVKVAEAKGEFDSDLLTLKSQLLLQEGDFEGAVQAVQRAFESDPTVPNKQLLLSLIRLLVEKDHDRGMKYAVNFIDELRSRFGFGFFASEVNGLIEGRQFQRAFELVGDLWDQDWRGLQKEELSFNVQTYDRFKKSMEVDEDSVLDSMQTSVRLDSWSVNAIHQIYRQVDFDFKETIEREIAQFIASKLGEPEFAMRLFLQFRELVKDEKLLQQLFSQAVLSKLGHQSRAVLDQIDSVASENVRLSAMVTRIESLMARKDFQSCESLIGRLRLDFPNGKLDGRSVDEWIARWREAGLERTSDSKPGNFANRKTITTYTKVDATSSWDFYRSRLDLTSHDEKFYESYDFRFVGQTGEIEIVDQLGVPKYRFLARKTRVTSLPTYNQYIAGRVSIRDGLVAVDIGTEIFMFDWERMVTGEDPVLWNLSVDDGARIAENGVPEFWGATETFKANRNYESRVLVTHLGLEGICYLTNTELVCLDVETGQKRWARPTGLPRSVLYSSDQSVFLWNPRKRVHVEFDISSGEMTRVLKLPEEVGSLWKPVDGLMLCSTVEADPEYVFSKDESGAFESENDDAATKGMVRMLGLYNPFAQAFVWKKNFPMKTVACEAGWSQMAIMQPSGPIEFLNLLNGKVDFEVAIPIDEIEREAYSQIGIAIKDGNYLVHVKKPETPNRFSLRNRKIEIRYLNYNDQMWNAHLILVDPDEAKPVWSSTVKIENFQILDRQPKGLPYYLLVRRVEREDGSSEDYLQFTGIDLRTGHLAFHRLAPYTYRTDFELVMDAKDRSLIIGYSGHQIKVESETWEDGPPEPLAYLTNANSIPAFKNPFEKRKINREALELDKARHLEAARAEQKRLERMRAEEQRLLELERSQK